MASTMSITASTAASTTSPAASPTASSSVSFSWTETVLFRMQLWYGFSLLVAFVAAIALSNILDGSRAAQLVQPIATGPGGRPLPATRRKSQDVSTVAFTPPLEVSTRVKRICSYICAGVSLSFVANAIAVIFHALSESKNPDSKYGWWCGEVTSVYLISGVFLHLYVLVYFHDTDSTANKPVAVFWDLSFLYEAAIFAANVVRVTGPHEVLRSVVRDIWKTTLGPDQWDYIDIAIASFRLAFLFLLVSSYSSVFLFRRKPRSRRDSPLIEGGDSSEDDEHTPLVRRRDAPSYNAVVKPTNDGTNGSVRGSTNGSASTVVGRGQTNGHANGINGHANDTGANGINGTNGTNGINGIIEANGANGTNVLTNGLTNGHIVIASGASSVTSNQAHDSDTEQEETAFYRPRKLPHKTWWEYLTSYSIFFPYLWPSNSARLRLIVVICFFILIVQRVVNFLVPNQIGNITDAFEAKNGLPWAEILILIFYKVLQGQGGLLGAVRSLLWIPVSQYSYCALTTAAFEHVHSLSLDFHLGKRTGEVLSALNKGASINSFLEQITFQVFPMLVDLVVAIIYFLLRFGAIYATIAAVITVFYLHMTVKMASTRADLRRDMVNADREEEAVKNDSITSYETVKYFNAEAFEFGRYRRAIKNFQTAEAKVTWGLNNMNICQAIVFMCGILVILMVAAVEVNQGMRSVGDFVVMITYLGQLQGPLNFFGSFYRTVQQAMISGERLLELFKIKPTVVDRPDVKKLSQCSGHIRWSNVWFWYDSKRTALRDLSFDCSPGTTTAFVGESGGGKSTIFRLMFRYYNCQSGHIEIDGHKVEDVTIDSVRRHIGVVPQDTILFNETIMYNLKYANPSASDEEVFDACRAASIHDRILSFPDGYNTKVGDRGTRLSGGEKQRVAIARTILKNPKIIMLDEATSALDSETEQQIQAKLIRGGSLGMDRTLLIIAHRLSTITHADQIIVLHAGAIVEKGTHRELLELKGRYASMWEKQSQAEQAAVAARDATERANQLMSQAHIGSSSTPARGRGDEASSCGSLSSSTDLGSGVTASRQESVARSEGSSDDDHSPPKRT